MNKLPHKYRVPLVGLIMMLTMLLGLQTIMTYRNLPEGALFLDLWFTAIGQTAPLALLMAVVVGSLANLLAAKVLVEPKDA